MEIVIATSNPGKFEELKKLLEIDGIVYKSLSEFGINNVPEEGFNFHDISLYKAFFVANEINMPVISDDSGLEIFALKGFPGNRSARCAGDKASDIAKTYFILGKMHLELNRKARFTSVVSFIDPQDIFMPISSIGCCVGTLLHEPRGNPNPGLQYDAIFLHPDYDKTFAEISKEEKNKVSHRARACRNIRDYLIEYVKIGKK